MRHARDATRDEARLRVGHCLCRVGLMLAGGDEDSGTEAEEMRLSVSPVEQRGLNGTLPAINVNASLVEASRLRSATVPPLL